MLMLGINGIVIIHTDYYQLVHPIGYTCGKYYICLIKIGFRPPQFEIFYKF